MAETETRNVKWRIPFKTRTETDCIINIYEDGWEGAVTEISDVNPDTIGYAAADPFTIEEDDDGDMLSVIRQKTAYIRLVEREYDSLRGLYPQYATHHYVTFFRDGQPLFTGYMQCDSYDNDWRGAPREIEFPCFSPLGMLDAMYFQGSNGYQPGYVTIGSLLKEVVTGLNAGVNSIVIPDEHQDRALSFLQLSISSGVFVPETSNIWDFDGNLKMYEPKRYADFMEALCKCYGLVAHDMPGKIVFTKYEYTDRYVEIDTGDIGEDGITPTRTPVEGTESTADLQGLGYVSSDGGEESYIRPLDRITVSYPIKEFPGTRLPYGRCIKNWIPCAYAPAEWDAAEALPQTPLLVNGLPIQGAEIDSSGNTQLGVLIGSIFHEGSQREGVYVTGVIQPREILRFIMYDRPQGVWKVTMKIYGSNTTVGCATTTDTGPFGRLSVKCGSLYATPSDGWRTEPYYYQLRGETDLTMPDPPGWMEPVQLVIEGTATISVPCHVITDVDVKKDENSYLSYIDPHLDFKRIIKGSDTNRKEASIDLEFYDDDALSYATYTKMAAREGIYSAYPTTGSYSSPGNRPEYPYMFLPQDRVTADMRLTGTLPEIPYANPYAFFRQGWKWRLIAMSYYAREDTYRLTLHHSPVLDVTG